MLNQDMRAFEVQYKRIRMYLLLAVQPCLLRQLDSDWHEAQTWDDKARVVSAWIRNISDGEVWLFGEGDDDDDRA